MNSMNESALDIKGQEIVDQAYELVGLVELGSLGFHLMKICNIYQ
jgi:hypothetical protein